MSPVNEGPADVTYYNIYIYIYIYTQFILIIKHNFNINRSLFDFTLFYFHLTQ